MSVSDAELIKIGDAAKHCHEVYLKKYFENVQAEINMDFQLCNGNEIELKNIWARFKALEHLITLVQIDIQRGESLKRNQA